MNKIILTGNLGKDAEERTNSNNKKFWMLTIATNETYKDKDGQKQTITTWHNCMLYGNYENLVPYLRKGQSVEVVGLQRHDNYEKDGQKQYYSYVKVNEIGLLGSKSESRPQPEPGPEQQQKTENSAPAPSEEPLQTDDLPF